MPATLMKTCRTCRFVFEFPARCETFACPACDALNGRPQAEGGALESLSRATAQRLRCDFHNAVNSYQHVLLDSPEEHEALWGLALCRYGIEYVDDPRTGRRMPTVHSVRRKPMQLDPDYLAALDCAPEDVRVQYEQEAQYIDDAMAKIIELSEKCPPFDVFLCHKTTKPDSEAHTEDYDRAFDLYHELTMQGYKVFFAPKEMAGVAAGSDYEAAIYHALDTAKVMLLICSDADYLTSAWVRSEWTRFLEMADEKQGKCLLPLMYGGFAAKVLPREIGVRKLEGLVMEDLNAKNVILNLLEKMCGKRTPVIKIYQDPAEKPEIETKPVKELPYTPEEFFEVEPYEDGCMITGFTGDDSLQNLYIPPTIREMKVLDIQEEAFVPKGEDKAAHFFDVVYLPETLNNLSGMSLDGLCCREFRTSDASESLLSVRDGVLFIRDKLIRYPMESDRSSYTVPNGTRVIFNSAFASAKAKEIKLPEGLQEICANAFWMSGVEKMTLPRSLTKLGAHVFHGCLSLVLGVYRDSYAHQAVMELGLRHEVLDATGHPVKEQILYTPESDFTVEPYEDGWMITGYTGKAIDLFIPPNIKGKPVRRIGSYAFVANAEEGKLYEPERAIGTLYLPATLQGVMSTSFQGISVGEFRVEKSNPDLEARDGVLFRKSKGRLIAYPHDKEASSYTVPAGTREICNLAFCWCTNLREVILPDSLREIGHSAFSNCINLSSLQLPEGLETVGGPAFSNCSSLTSLTIPRSVTNIHEQAFSECSAMLRVCRGSQAHVMLKNAKEPRAYELLGPSGQTLEKATLVYSWKAKTIGIAWRVVIRFDGKDAQMLSAGGRITFKLTPGRHLIETLDQLLVLGIPVGEVNWAKGEKVHTGYTHELQPGEVREIDL